MDNIYTIEERLQERDSATLLVAIRRLRTSREVTEIGCLLMLLGLPQIIQPLTWISGLVNGSSDAVTGEPKTVTYGLPFAILIGNVCCTTIGVLTVLVGYAAAFHRSGNATVTTSLSVFVQSAYILIISMCMRVTRIASPVGSYEYPRGSLASYEQPNNQLLAAMGVLAIISYWFGMLGSISVLLGSLSKFQSSIGHERDARYYRARLLFYSFILFVGGFSQATVGVQLYMIHGPGPLPNNSVYDVAMFIVAYPAMSIAVGVVQVSFHFSWELVIAMSIVTVQLRLTALSGAEQIRLG